MKKIVAIGAVLLTGLMFALPVYAEVTEEQNMDVSGGNATGTCIVEAEVGGDFTVTIPKKIVLSRDSYSSTYEVTVSGNIAGDEKVIVSPDESFEMAQANKPSVKMAVTQDVTEFLAEDLAKEDENALVVGTTVFGTVSVQEGSFSAGKWEGTFNFTICLITQEENIPETN